MNLSSLFDLTGKTALVTGSSEGLGLAMARGLAAAGARLILNGRDEQKLANAARSFAESGHKVETRDRKSTRLNSSHLKLSRMPSSA